MGLTVRLPALSQPAAGNATPDGGQQNRRGEVIIRPNA